MTQKKRVPVHLQITFIRREFKLFVSHNPCNTVVGLERTKGLKGEFGSLYENFVTYYTMLMELFETRTDAGRYYDQTFGGIHYEAICRPSYCTVHIDEKSHPIYFPLETCPFSAEK